MTHTLDQHAQFAAHSTIRLVQIKKELTAAIDGVCTKTHAPLVCRLKSIEKKLEDLACDCADEARTVAARIEKGGR